MRTALTRAMERAMERALRTVRTTRTTIWKTMAKTSQTTTKKTATQRKQLWTTALMKARKMKTQAATTITPACTRIQTTKTSQLEDKETIAVETETVDTMPYNLRTNRRQSTRTRFAQAIDDPLNSQTYGLQFWIAILDCNSYNTRKATVLD